MVYLEKDAGLENEPKDDYSYKESEIYPEIPEDNDLCDLEVECSSILAAEEKEELLKLDKVSDILKKYQKHKVLGRGSYGKVCLVKRKSDDQYFAMKEISKIR